MGIGHSGVSRYWFNVNLKSPKLLTVPFGLSTGTIGVAQSELSTSFNIASFSGRLISAAIYLRVYKERYKNIVVLHSL